MLVWITLKLKCCCSRVLGMIRNTLLTWGIGIASLSLLAAVGVYTFARFYPPVILESFQVTGTDLETYTSIFGSAPSFFYTLALGLLIGICASNRSSAILHCLIWIGIALVLEFSQHPTVAESISIWTRTNFPDSISRLIGPYWTRGAFDRLDLIATLIGGFIALVLLTYLPRDASDARD